MWKICPLVICLKDARGGTGRKKEPKNNYLSKAKHDKGQHKGRIMESLDLEKCISKSSRRRKKRLVQHGLVKEEVLGVHRRE